MTGYLSGRQDGQLYVCPVNWLDSWMAIMHYIEKYPCYTHGSKPRQTDVLFLCQQRKAHLSSNIIIWKKCSDGLPLYERNVLMAYHYLKEMFWWLTIIWKKCSDGLPLSERNVLMAYHYMKEMFWWLTIIWKKCSDGLPLSERNVLMA